VNVTRKRRGKGMRARYNHCLEEAVRVAPKAAAASTSAPTCHAALGALGAEGASHSSHRKGGKRRRG
jgi:hypothetical protein